MIVQASVQMHRMHSTGYCVQVRMPSIPAAIVGKCASELPSPMECMASCGMPTSALRTPSNKLPFPPHYPACYSSTAQMLTSRMECMASCGTPMSTVRTPRPDARIGPIVDPHAMSDRTCSRTERMESSCYT